MIRPVPSHLAYFSAHFGAAPADDYLTKVTLDTAKEARNASGQSWFPGVPVKTVAMAAVAARAAYLEAAKEASEPNLQKDPNALKGPFTKLADSAAYDYNRPENTVSGSSKPTRSSSTSPRRSRHSQNLQTCPASTEHRSRPGPSTRWKHGRMEKIPGYTSQVARVIA